MIAVGSGTADVVVLSVRRESLLSMSSRDTSVGRVVDSISMGISERS